MKPLRIDAAGDRRRLANEPLDETQLTAEISRILERRRERSSTIAAAPAPKQRWLGDEADEAYVAACMTADDDDLAGTSSRKSGEARSPLAVSESTTTASLTEPSTLAWVRTAKRQRTSARLKSAAGWTLSLLVSLTLVAAVGFALAKWSSPGRTPSTAMAPMQQGQQADAGTDATPPSLRFNSLR